MLEFTDVIEPPPLISENQEAILWALLDLGVSCVGDVAEDAVLSTDCVRANLGHLCSYGYTTRETREPVPGGARHWYELTATGAAAIGQGER